MDRRNFLGSIAGGTLFAGAAVFVRSAVAMPASASAASTLSPCVRTQPVLVVHRSDLPGSTALATAIVGALRAEGMPATLLDRSGPELASFASIDSVLRGAHGARVAGVMDDAAALLFQQLAASQGGSWLVEGQHRFDGGDVRHRLNAVGASALAWSEPVEGWAPRIARRYTEIVTGRPATGAIDAGASPANGEADATRLVSFVIDLHQNHNGRPER